MPTDGMSEGREDMGDDGASSSGPSAADRARRNLPWSLAGYSLSRVLTLLTTIVLARLLTPEDFGVVALATLALTVVNVLSDVGLTSVLVVRQDLDRRAQGTLLSMLLAAGAAFSALLVGAAPALADVFREPALAEVLRALAALSFLSGFYWFYDMLLQRELEFRSRFIAQLARTGAYAASAILLAALGAGVWSLVVGQLVGAVVVSAVLLRLAPYRVRPAFDRAVARSAVRDGHGFLLQAGATTVQDNLDFVIVGRALGADALGAYSMAYRLGEIPYAAIADPVARVSFPAFARMRHAGDDVAPGFLLALQLVALATWPLGLILSAAAEPFTRAILGEQWLPMVGPLGVLGVWSAVRATETTVGWFLNAMGQATRSGRISTLLLIPLVLALIAGVELGGTTGVAWVLVVHLAVTLLLLARVAARQLDVSVRRQGLALTPLLVPAMGCWGAARLAADATAGLPAAASLAVATLVASALYLLLVHVMAGPLARAARHELRRMLGSIAAPRDDRATGRDLIDPRRRR